MQVTINQHSFNCNRGFHVPQHVIDSLNKQTGDASSIIEQIRVDMFGYLAKSGEIAMNEEVVTYSFNMSRDEQDYLLDTQPYSE